LPEKTTFQDALSNFCLSYPVTFLQGNYLIVECLHGGADKSLARPTSRGTLFDGENISFDASLVIYINNINIPPIMVINRVYENQNLLSL